MTEPLLKLTGISKSFAMTDVLININLEVYAGEVLCLLGDNGAGKSTLIKVLSGFHEPTSGTMTIDGKPVEFKSPRDASDHGIATVHQFGGTFPLMSIGRSFFVGAEPTKGWGPLRRFDRKFAGEVAVVMDLCDYRPIRLRRKVRQRSRGNQEERHGPRQGRHDRPGPSQCCRAAQWALRDLHSRR